MKKIKLFTFLAVILALAVGWSPFSTPPDASQVGLGNVSNAAQVDLQSATPGSPQTGHLNISGTAIAGTFSGSGSGLTSIPVGATYQATIASPTAPNSTGAYLMQGLAGAITPAKSGNILIIISGTLIASTTTINDGVRYRISYGTSSAPTSNTALAGTQVGPIQTYTNPIAVTAADVHVPFSVSAVVTGLSSGTPYWIDLAAESITTTSDTGFQNVGISVIEQ